MAPYIVGIDLGTTHTVVAWAPSGAVADDAIEVLAIEQLVALGEVAARPLLPSVLYHPAANEIPAADLVLPWGPGPEGRVVGSLARELGAQVPGRLVTSAKSWLSHAAVDRLAPILPWGAPDDVARISPVAASASVLAHVRAAWNWRRPQAPLEEQEIVLTVPASFDDVARALTLEAAREAGLPTLRLLEEPQAALYDWLFRHRRSLSSELAGTGLVLVCDVGGGTTDLSLVRVEMRGSEPRLERVAVGSHLMLGGDNMDLALAHRAEGKLAAAAGGQRLAPGALSQLIERCRAAKERLLARDAAQSVAVTLLGAGSRLVGGARTVDLQREEAERIVIDGFFPRVAADELPRRARTGSGLVAFGLPYASDAAVTRHLAAFLQQHRGATWPDAVLLNGGVFRAHAIAMRLHETLADWRGAALKPLHNADPDIAVARGAVAYALARRGLAPKIAAGAARNYFLRVESTAGDAPRGICVLPRGSEEGHEVPLAGRSFALKSGEPVRFDLVATTAGTVAAGAQVDLGELDAQPLPPVATVLRTPGGRGSQEIPVHLASTLTGVGTLALYCIADEDPGQRWRLEFQLRGEGTAAPAQGLPPRFAEAVALIERVFGSRDRLADPKAVKQLRSQLEALFGQREQWSLGLLRALFDALLQRARGRRRSADHERVWLSLTGWCLRPGFGDPLDAWRIERLWPLYGQGVHQGRDAQVCAEWWTLWRRVAGGLDEAAQQRLLEDFAINLRGNEIDPADLRQMQRPVKGGWDDMVRMCATLERIPSEHKVEVGDWLVGQLQRANPKARSPWTLWSIGRIGARLPFHGSAHRVVPADAAAAWLEVLLALDWKQVDGAAAAAANLARLSGDRVRDLPADLREQVVDRLTALRAPPAWIARVREVVPLDDAGQQGVFGEALPLGLKLIDREAEQETP
ncbi:Hsp70 family protein [Ramlibacter alkalitolerans]|uniref:Hsp70 family protein n=1 Tax=Ramlibacter alkalitolerans TaxID=2039631 RepID=A0ABS1JM67_9BURK|nr:Hsp70 family protein [Ramlibacter alkalitolerans]MBL0425226.1 hsp70 family protein [Ramlibacter alkalitolerans]